MLLAAIALTLALALNLTLALALPPTTMAPQASLEAAGDARVQSCQASGVLLAMRGVPAAC